MVALFKKKNSNAEMPKKTVKKPLFSKKSAPTTIKNNDDLVVNGRNINLEDDLMEIDQAGAMTAKPVKKSSLSFGKKNKPSNDKTAKPALFGKKSKTATKPIKSTSKSVKEKPEMNKQRLLILIGGLLSLVLLALAAKLFLSAPETVAPPPSTAITAAPAPSETPMPAEPVAAPETQVVATEVPPAQTNEAVAPVATSSEQPNAPIATEAPAPIEVTAPPVVAEVPAVNTTPDTTPQTAAPAPSGKISYEEFIQQSQTRVYRERSTGPSGQ